MPYFINNTNSPRYALYRLGPDSITVLKIYLKAFLDFSNKMFSHTQSLRNFKISSFLNSLKAPKQG